jgi:pyrroline-5-carboxylate reductase
MKPKIGILGAGNMGSSLYRGLSNIFSEEQIFISDIDEEKLEQLNAKNAFAEPDDLIKEVDIIIFAVKPQVFSQLIYDSEYTMEDKLIISIMAGVNTEKIYELTASPRIIRSMPNLGVSVGAGLIGWIASNKINQEEKEMVKNIFRSLGEEIELSNEEEINQITALSGSGPAYFFLLTKILKEKAISMGFDQSKASIIARSTIASASKLLEQNEYSIEEWIEKVSSKGGTTEAALTSLRNQKIETVFSNAVDSAKEKADELTKTAAK